MNFTSIGTLEVSERRLDGWEMGQERDGKRPLLNLLASVQTTETP